MRKLLLVLFLFFVAVGIYFIFGGQPETPPSPPPPLPAGSTMPQAKSKKYTVHIAVPHEMQAFAKQKNSFRKVITFLSKGDNRTGLIPENVEYANGQVLLTLSSPNLEQFFDQIKVTVIADKFGLLTQRVPLKNTLHETKPSLYFYSMHVKASQNCSTKQSDSPFVLAIKISPEAKAKFRKGKKYVVTMTYMRSDANGEFPTNVSAQELSTEQLSQKAVDLKFSVPKLMLSAKGSFSFEFAECSPETPTNLCFDLSSFYEASSAWILAHQNLAPLADVCPGGYEDYLLAPSDENLSSILHREMPDLSR